MKKNTKLLLIMLLSYSSLCFSQTNVEVEKIKKDYNLNRLTELSENFKARFLQEKAIALEMAAQKGWSINYTDNNGSFYELMKVSENGNPIYYKTYNTDAALSTRTNWLHNNGGLGLDLEGQGMTAYVWDSGPARSTHQEYDGLGGENRYSIGDGSTTLSDHGSHVTGTIIASGVDVEAKGMAPQANGLGHDWNNDLAEITAAAANGMLLSNHSYGVPPQNLQDWQIGAYLSSSSSLDEVIYNAPYYLSVWAAGNSGNDNSSNGNPLEGDASFDKLTLEGVSKNNLVVANAQDATINSDGTLDLVSINNGSSEGPTDDLRIKPDITGNGTGLRSTLESSDTAYGTFSGTSMASPNVMGSLLLLQQHYNNVNGNFMRAATLKGLVLHTADDAGPVGPDAIWGWGLLNTKKAAETITNASTTYEIKELELLDGQSITINVLADGNQPLIGSISWSDVPGTVNTGTANDGTPALVNDLDLRISNVTDTYLPWKLTSVNTNAQEDNFVDPFERIEVDSPGEYTVTITHKGTLTNGSQKFSLILTGVASNYTISTPSPSVDVCSPNDAVYNLTYNTSSNFSETTTFSVSGLPSGATATFNPTTAIANGTAVTATISGIASVTQGTSDFTFIGTAGSITKNANVSLNVFNDVGNNTLTAPANSATDISLTPILTWDLDSNATSYDVEVATDNTFATIISSENVTTNSYSLSGLNQVTTYYWRVRGKNFCGEGNYSSIFSFTTESCFACASNGTAFDTATTLVKFNTIDNASAKSTGGYGDYTSISTTVQKGESHTITINANTGGDFTTHTLVWIDWNQNCNLEASEQYDLGIVTDTTDGITSLSPLSITIPSQASIGNTVMRVSTRYNVDPTSCREDFDGEVEDYTVMVEGNPASIEDFAFSGFNLYPNPSTGEFTLNLELIDTEKVSVKLFDIRGRLINEKNFFNTNANFSEKINFNNAAKGLYLVKITNGNKQTTRKLVIE